jgi:butyryl-CoA dehydrogenase
VFGGYGYTRDFPVERLFRDQRLNPIHEGTTGIQGLDLLGRKVRMEGGRALALLLREMRADAEFSAEGALAVHAGALLAAAERIARVTEALLAAPDAAAALANATIYLDMVGTACIAWMHLKMAAAATGGSPLHEGKRAACDYFFRYELPATEAQAALLESLDETCLRVPVAAF